MIETFDDIIEELADKCGVYGAGPEEDHPDDCQCRICFTIGIKDRIKKTILPTLRNEIAISIISSSSIQEVKRSKKRLLTIWLDDFWKVIKGDKDHAKQTTGCQETRANQDCK